MLLMIRSGAKTLGGEEQQKGLSGAFLPLFVLGSAAVGGAVAYFTGRTILIGVTVGFFLGFSPLVLLGTAYFLLIAWRPDRPICRCGKCQSERYDFIGTEQVSDGKIYRYRCPVCGREYKQKDNRFWEYMRDASEIPYMRISKWGRWQMESADSTRAADVRAPRR